jgi:hypothetical protein
VNEATRAISVATRSGEDSSTGVDIGEDGHVVLAAPEAGLIDTEPADRRKIWRARAAST